MATKSSSFQANLYCIGWGHLQLGEGSIHADCPVVLTKERVGESAVASELLASGKAFPMVCPCECSNCGKAWWAAGRPILKDGKIVTASSFI